MAPPVVLLVEDSPELALIVSALGRRGGYAVIHRPDVPSAWHSLQESGPDLVLLDLRLPGESGLELCRRVRADERLAGLAVALFGHGGLSADAAAALEAGVDFFVAKELLSQPDAWQRRLGEILPPAHGQPRQRPLGWTAEPAGAPPDDWIQRLHAALRHPSLRAFGPEARRLLLRRAVRQARPGGVPDLEDLLDPERVGPARTRSILPPEGLWRLIASLMDQVWCFLGSEAGAPVRAALAAVLPAPPPSPNQEESPRNQPPACR
jgi:CheY-like chemotaxis protein